MYINPSSRGIKIYLLKVRGLTNRGHNQSIEFTNFVPWLHLRLLYRWLQHFTRAPFCKNLMHLRLFYS